MSYCDWALVNAKMKKYHDEEWGVPVHDDRRQFEFLMMEVMQCGLNWNMMLQKRDIFRRCFADFDFDLVANYTATDIESICHTDGMIRSPRKIAAIVHNAECFCKIRADYGSFSNYIWEYSDGKTILYSGHELGDVPASNDLSDIISKDLKKRGFKFIGSITVYSHLQACGIINDHDKECFCYQKIIDNYPTVKK